MRYSNGFSVGWRMAGTVMTPANGAAPGAVRAAGREEVERDLNNDA
jgi:hypothetical protein